MRTRVRQWTVLAVALSLGGTAWAQEKASNPSPADGATEVSAPLFSWTAGSKALFHDVYLGKTPELTLADLVGYHQPKTMFFYMGTLEPGVVYYWRVNEIEGDGITVHAGDVWTFVTQPLVAHQPDPADGATLISPDVILKWLPGMGAAQHRVYFSDNSDAVVQGAASANRGLLPLATTAFTPGPLVEGTTWWWRVDEVAADGTVYAGPVWSFTVPRQDMPWIPLLPDAKPGAAYTASVCSQDDTGTAVSTEVPGLFSMSIVAGGRAFQKLTIPQGKYATAVGKPMVPVIRTYLEVPYDVNLTVEIVDSQYVTLDKVNVYPVQPPLSESSGGAAPEFVLDEKTYTTDAFYPGEQRPGGETVIIRDHRVLPLVVTPVQFNPVRQQVRIYTRMRVRINYDRPARIEGIQPRLELPSFEVFCKEFIINYKYPWEYLTRRPHPYIDPGADYLIITPDSLKSAAQTLADWKIKKGLNARITTLSGISSSTPPTADDITNYLQNAYDTWHPVPAYVLLLGDANSIPVHYRTPHPSPRHGGHHTATDLYYATLDGTDFFPDIFVGRASADTLAEANTIVDKIVAYESNPPTQASFYSDASVCAYFQDDNRDGFEDRRFVLTSEEIRDFLQGKGYSVERIYTTDAGVTPTNYNNGSFDSGNPLPSGIAWTGTTADISAAFNAGRFLITYRDHGESRNFWNVPASQWGTLDGWNNPQYTTTDVAGLTNGSLLPVVFSICCQSGWFDGETDPDNQPMTPVTPRNSESFCEELLRHSNGGAIAAIGSTRNSYSGLNDDLTRGMIDAVWPDFDSTLTTGAMYELGQILTYGKVHMAVETGGPDRTTFELFHLFGDPEMRIWTAEPATLIVDHPDTIGAGSTQNFVVKVHDGSTPVAHATVGLYKGVDVHVAGYTDPSGDAVFSVFPADTGTVNVTVTAPNYRPYQGTIAVTPTWHQAVEVVPDHAPVGASCTVSGRHFADGEMVALELGGASCGTVSAPGGYFSVACTVPSVPTGVTNLVARGQSSGRVAVTTFHVLPLQLLPDPYSYSQWDSSTWPLDPSNAQVWDSPCIRLKWQNTPFVVPSSSLRVGTPYTIEAFIYNASGAAAANNTQVTFEWTTFGAGQGVWNLIGTDTVDVPITPGSAVAKTTWTPITTGHCCVRVTISHPWDTNVQNNMGQENTEVLPISSPAEVQFTVGNPTNAPGRLQLEVAQRDAAKTADLWATRVDQPCLDALAPGETRTATLRVVAPDGAKVGDTRVLNVTGTLNGQIVGGFAIRVVKDHPPSLTGGAVDPEKGAPGLSFRYRVVYQDSDNHPPLQDCLLLSVFSAGRPVAGSPFVMREEDGKDTVYTDGKAYIYDLVLPDGATSYSYSFQAFDTLEVEATGPATAVRDGPMMGEPTFVVVDDFESYTDEPPHRIFDVWIDGWTNGTGSTVGYLYPPYTEQKIVHSGGQSMPLDYNNVGWPFYSEAERGFAPVQDWTAYGANTLVLYVHGTTGNATASFHVAVEDTSGKTFAVYGDSALLTATTWGAWKIPLSNFAGVNLTRVKGIRLAIGDRRNPRPGGAGRIYLDDIRVIRE